VVLADSRKFARVAPAYVFGLDEVTTIVTDDGVPDDVRTSLEERDVRVVIAPTPPGTGVQ